MERGIKEVLKPVYDINRGRVNPRLRGLRRNRKIGTSSQEVLLKHCRVLSGYGAVRDRQIDFKITCMTIETEFLSKSYSANT